MNMLIGWIVGIVLFCAWLYLGLKMWDKKWQREEAEARWRSFGLKESLDDVEEGTFTDKLQ